MIWNTAIYIRYNYNGYYKRLRLMESSNSKVIYITKFISIYFNDKILYTGAVFVHIGWHGRLNKYRSISKILSVTWAKVFGFIGITLEAVFDNVYWQMILTVQEKSSSFVRYWDKIYLMHNYYLLFDIFVFPIN